MKIILFIGLLFVCALGQTNLVVYDGTTGQLENGFDNWSWATVDLQNTAVVPPGDKYSISVVVQNYQALYFHANSPFTVSSFTSLSFKINGGSTSNSPIIVSLLSGGTETGKPYDISSQIQTNAWSTVSIPAASFGADPSTVISGVWWQANTGGVGGTIYLDDIVFVTAPPPPITPVSITLDLTKRTQVSNLIYGVNWANASQLARNRYTTNRWGGEAVTRYAYDVDTENHASDWYFENLPNAVPNPNTLPFNSTCDAFIQNTFSASAVPIITIPIIGYTPIDRNVRCGFSVKKYGAQQSTDPWQPDCGNGIKTDGKTPITGNDPLDTSRVINETFVLAWLNHIDQAIGKGKVQLFELDNEPGLWNTIHRDVHPNPLTYDELWTKTVQYAGAIKKAYPNSKIFGPIPWGWCEYMFSPADGCSDGPDRKAHGDLPMLEWYIQQLGQYKQKYGIQLVDVIDVHAYPTTNSIGTDAEDPQTAALRLRSTRSFWDPTYVDESWVATAIDLLPTIQGWIDKYNPGLTMAVSEYNWGADDIVTGALAQVMILGIFGKNNVFLATRWVAPALDTKTEEAFRIFTNYDGNGAHVQGDSVVAVSNDTDNVEAYAFDNNNSFYVVIVNKINSSVPVVVNVPSSVTQGATVTLYSFSQSQALGRTGSTTVSNSAFSVNTVGWSATLAIFS
jgi:hypothetical protein